MLNLLKYRDTALYADGAERPPCMVHDAYAARYIPAFDDAVGPN